MPFTADTIKARKLMKFTIERLDLGALDKLDAVNGVLTDFKLRLCEMLSAKPNEVKIEKAIICYEIVAMDALRHCFALLHRFDQNANCTYLQELQQSCNITMLQRMHLIFTRIIEKTRDVVAGHNNKQSGKNELIFIRKNLLHKMIYSWSDKALLGAIKIAKNLESEYIHNIELNELVDHIKFLKRQLNSSKNTLSILHDGYFQDRLKRIDLYEKLINKATLLLKSRKNSHLGNIRLDP